MCRRDSLQEDGIYSCHNLFSEYFFCGIIYVHNSPICQCYSTLSKRFLLSHQVQRSVEDQSILVATYEGEHNHPHPSRQEVVASSSRCVTLASAPCPPSLSSSGPTITFDLTKPKPNTETKTPSPPINSPQFQQFLVEQMASSLTKDSGFKAALAAAISGRFLQHDQTEKW